MNIVIFYGNGTTFVELLLINLRNLWYKNYINIGRRSNPLIEEFHG